MEHGERRRSLVIGGAIVLSFALHGIAFAAVGGHGKGGALAVPASAVELDVALMEAPELAPQPQDPTPAKDDDHDHDHHPATHTHDYPVPPSHDETPHDATLIHAPLALPAPAVPAEPATHNAAAAAPEVAAAPAAPVAAPHFTMSLGAASRASGPVASSGTGVSGGTGVSSNGAADGTADGRDAAHPVAETGVDEPARVAFAPEPRYPAAAEAEGMEASVPVEIVVDASGAVRSARALGHAGYGLDDAAVAGVRAYRFTPARRRGQAVSVRMKWSVEFKLR